MSVTVSGFGLVVGVICTAIVGGIVLFAVAWGASTRREREIEGGPRR